MATKDFKVKAPDGSVITVRAPDTATQEQVFKFAKMQFEKRAQPQQEAAPTTRTPSGLMGRSQAIAQSRSEERERYLTELEQTNPFQAKALREMNPFERALIGVGAGFMDVARGVGLADQPEGIEAQSIEQIGESGGSFGVGRVVGQAAPFLPLSLGAGAATATGGIAAKAGGQAAVGALEGGLIARGTGGDTEDILAGAAIGGAIGGGAEVVAPYISRAARALVRKVRGERAAGNLIDDAGRPTPELQRALDDSGQSFDDLVQEAERQQKADTVGDVVAAGRRESPESAAQSIEVSPQRLEAAERLGLGEPAPVSVLTEDQATQELAGALAAVQGSRSSSALDAFTEEFGRRADKYIEDIGGSIDRGAVSDQLLDNIQSDISRIKALENRLYEPIDEAIGRGTQVEDYAAALQNRLSAKARNSGGIKRLPRHEREMLEMLNSKEGMTYQNLVDKMNDIGSAAYRKTSTYDDIDTASLKRMYGDLMKVRDEAAEVFGVGDKMKRAKALGQSRFAMQESSDALFGKDLNKSIFPKIDTAVKGIEKGRVREFVAAMESIPEKHRKSVAASMLNTAMTGGRDQSLGVNAGQFAKWYRNLERQPTAMNALRKYVGDEAVDRLDDFAELAKGVAGVTKGRVRTGITSETLKRLDDVDGVAGKLYSAAQRVREAPVVGRAAAAASNAAKMFTLDKTPAVEAADQVLGSTVFRRAVIEAAKNGTSGRKFRQLNASLKASPAYRKYINQLDKTTQSQIASSGLIAWLASEDEE